MPVTVDDLRSIEEGILFQKRFDLNSPVTGWLPQFMLQLFDLYFLPGLLLIIFLILSAPWFDQALYPLIDDAFTRYFVKALLFFVAAFYFIRTYIITVLND